MVESNFWSMGSRYLFTLFFNCAEFEMIYCLWCLLPLSSLNIKIVDHSDRQTAYFCLKNSKNVTLDASLSSKFYYVTNFLVFLSLDILSKDLCIKHNTPIFIMAPRPNSRNTKYAHKIEHNGFDTSMQYNRNTDNLLSQIKNAFHACLKIKSVLLQHVLILTKGLLRFGG